MASSTTSGNLTVYEHEEGDAGVRLAAAAHLPQVTGYASALKDALPGMH